MVKVILACLALALAACQQGQPSPETSQVLSHGGRETSMAKSWIVESSKYLDINRGLGGLTFDWIDMVDAAIKSGKTIRIWGTCNSACTVAAARARRMSSEQVCLGPKVVFGLHRSVKLREDGKLDYSASASVKWMYSRDFVAEVDKNRDVVENGGLWPVPPLFTYVGNKRLQKFYKSC